MASIRQSIRSSTASKRPTSAIADGQIALNTASGTPGMFFKDSAGNIIKTGPAHYGASAPNSSPAVGGSTGNSIGEAWLDSSLTPAGWKIWNGSAWVNATPLSSDTVQGLVELATNAETQAGADTARAVTSAGLQSKVSDSISTASSSGIASSSAVKTAYDLANAALPKSGGIITGNLEIGSTGSLTFEGSTADGFETTLAVVDPTLDRTITFPNITGTVVTTGDTGTVTSTMILDGTIVDADINASAEIAVSKLADGAARQLLQTDAAGTGVEWASNIDIPGTLDVTSAATFDSTVAVTGALTKSGNNVVTVGDTGTVTSTMILDGTILNADVNASAAIAGTKISPDFGAQTIVTTGVHSAAAGSAAAPSMTFTGDLNTGIYSPGADQLAISTNGTGRLFVDANGNVGIGATTVQSVLHLSASGLADLRFTDTGEATDQKSWTFQTGTGIGAGTFRLRAINDANSSGENAYLITKSGTSIQTHQWLTGGSERMRLTAGGLLGVGTSSPGYKFEVDNTGGSTATARLIGNDQANVRLRIQNTGTSGRAYEIVGGLNGANNSHLSIYDATAAATRLTITETGLVGVGTTSPGYTLDVSGTFRNTGIARIGTGSTTTLAYFGDPDTVGNKYIAFARASALTDIVNIQGVDAGVDVANISLQALGGRVGISTTSPSSVLDVASSNSGITLTNTGASNKQWRLGGSSAGSFVITETGISDRLTIDSSGRVGIGTSSPGSVLDCRGDFRSSNADSDRLVAYQAPRGSAPGFASGANGSAGIFTVGAGVAVPLAIGTFANTPLTLATDNTARLTVTGAGNVGIGTTSPATPLHVVGNTSLNGTQSAICNSTTGSYITWQHNGTSVGDMGTNNQILSGSTSDLAISCRTGGLAFGISGIEKARLDTSGRLLVGTSTAPSVGNGQYAKVVIQGSGHAAGNAGSFSLQRDEAASSITSGEGIAYFNFNDNAGNTFGTIGCEADANAGASDYPGRLVFSTTADGASSPTERMRINSAGGFKATTNGTSTSTTSATHEFYQSNNTETGLAIRCAGATFSDTAIAFNVDRNTTNNTYYFIRAGVTGVAYRFNVADSGNVTNTNNSYGAISDIKLKENIVDASSQWADIKAFRVRKYNLKEGQKHTQIGGIAQEVELVSPGLVTESPDRDAEGNDLGTVTKSINYSVLYMKAVKALQEAMERIETLEARLTAAGIA